VYGPAITPLEVAGSIMSIRSKVEMSEITAAIQPVCFLMALPNPYTRTAPANMVRNEIISVDAGLSPRLSVNTILDLTFL
jgi:hypothetical protein